MKDRKHVAREAAKPIRVPSSSKASYLNSPGTDCEQSRFPSDAAARQVALADQKTALDAARKAAEISKLAAEQARAAAVAERAAADAAKEAARKAEQEASEQRAYVLDIMKQL
jgi:hypothetical protein